MATLEELETWITEPEGERLEFKEAKNDYDFEKLTKYCCALSNEGGGRMILGVSNRRPRTVVGSRAFQTLDRTRTGLINRLHLRIEASEISHTNGRVIVFEVPARPVGMAVQYEGAYWMRRGEELVAMTPEMLRRTFSEGLPDFSVEVRPGVGLDAFDLRAVELFREKWIKKSGRNDLAAKSVQQLLEDAELLVDGQVTNAAVLLLGTERAVGRLLPEAEFIIEYRSGESSIPYQARQEFRAGFLVIHDSLWEFFNRNNQVHSIRDGLFRREVRAFNEDAVREAILNAFCHRDYRLAGSIFIRQFPGRAEIQSPGGFPPGISPENILFRQSPRNRRLAEACARCGLVERSGQGLDLMFSASVQEGKLPPDFSGSDSCHVALTLHGQVRDVGFLQFLEKVSSETQRAFRIEDLVVLDAIHRGVEVPALVEQRVSQLIDLGVLERPGRKKLMLSRKFYTFVGKRAEYTRKKGLDRSAKMALLQQHLAANASDGCPLGELVELFPELSHTQVQVLLRDLKEKGLAHSQGTTRAAKWFPGPKAGDKR